MSSSDSGGSGEPAACAPQARGRLEPVPRHEPPSLARHERDRPHEEVEHRLADEVVEVHAHPAGLDALAPARDLALELVRALDVDAEQSMAVRARARAAAARLDTEQVVEQRDDEVVVEIAAVVPDDERHDRQPWRVGLPSTSIVGFVAPGAIARPMKSSSRSRIVSRRRAPSAGTRARRGSIRRSRASHPPRGARGRRGRRARAG